MENVYLGVRSWWSYLASGLTGIALGVILLIWPGDTLWDLALITGCFAVCFGGVELVTAIVRIFDKQPVGVVLFSGALSLLMGLLLLTKTGLTLILIADFIAVWMIAVGVVEVATALDMPPNSERGWLAISGLVSLALGICILSMPFRSIWALIVIFSIFLLATSCLRLIMAFITYRLQRKLQGTVDKAVEE